LAGTLGLASAGVTVPTNANQEPAPLQEVVSDARLSDECGAQAGFEFPSLETFSADDGQAVSAAGETETFEAAPPSNWLTYARRDGGSYNIAGHEQVGIRFKLSDFDCDTVTIDSVKAYYYCVGAGSPWLDTTVVLRIYDAGSDTELWNSGPREVPVAGVGACSLKVALAMPLKTGRDFLVVSDPVAPGGTPHIWGDYIQRFRSLSRDAVAGPWSVDSATPTTYRLMARCSPRVSVPPPAPGARLLHETFEGSTWPPAGWALTQSSGSYPWTRVTTSSNPSITGAFLYAFPQPVSPNYYYMARMYSRFAPAGNWARIATPAVNVGAGPTVVKTRFQFYQDPGWSVRHDSLYVEVSTAGQSGPWTVVAGLDRQRSIAGWYETVVPLGVYSGNIWVAWRAVSKNGNNIVFDHPMVYLGSGVDMGVSRLVGTRTEPRFVGDMDTFQIRVANFGTLNQTGVRVVLDVDGEIVDSVAVNVNSGMSVDTLLRWTPTTGGSRNLRFYTELPGDEDATNDTLRRTDYVVTTVSSLDEGFEGTTFPPVGWAVKDSNGVDGTWSRSTMRRHTGAASARTSPDPGPYARGAHDVLYTPVCDLTGAPAWKFSFWRLDSIEDRFEHVYLEYATNVLPDASPPPVWFPLKDWTRSDPVTWIQYDTILRDGLTSRWRFRWRFTADLAGQLAGTWIDDVKLAPVPANDIGVQSLVSVQSFPLTIGSEAAFRVRIRNYGTITQSGPVALLVDGAVIASLPLVGPIPAFGVFDTVLAWTPAATGPVNLKFCTALSPDADPMNDTLELSRYVNPAAYLPDYREDFNEDWEDCNSPPWFGWRIANGGSEYPPVQNRNDWIKYSGAYDAATTEGSGIPGGATEIPNDSLISPRFDCSDPGSYALSMWYDFSVWALPDSMRILLSTDDGENWSVIRASGVADSGIRTFDLTARVSGESNVRIAFVHINTVPNGSPYNYWDIDWFALTYVPEPPTLSLPVSGDTINQTRPTFGWYESPRAIRYWLQVDDDPSFGSPDVNDSSSSSGSFTPATPLVEGRWFWRVAASKDVAVWSSFCSPDSFWIDLTPPAIPELRLPLDNVLLGTATPTFHWTAVSFKGSGPGDARAPGSGADFGPVSYDIEVASDSTFPGPSIIFARTLTDTFVTATVLPDERLFWHVRGRDGAGNTGDYSNHRAFEVDTRPPDAPVLHAPANESYLNISGPTFCWGVVRLDHDDVGHGKTGTPEFRNPVLDGAPVTYRIEVASDSTFPGPSIVFTANLADTEVVTNGLPKGRLFWHVRGEDGVGNIGAYSQPWTFTIMTDPLPTPMLRQPANHVLTLERSPRFIWNRVVPGADALVSYRLQVSTESLFVSPLVNTFLAETAWTPATPLAFAKFYWRVMARDTAGNTGPYSARWDLTVVCPAEWVAMPALPPGGKAKNVKDGGALAYGKEGTGGQGPGFANDTGYVYAFKGNNRYEFYRFNTISNAWISRESIPAIGSTSKKKPVKKGATLVMAGDGMVYGAKGNGTLEWWQFDPVANTWTEKASVLSGAKALKEGVGSAAVTIGSDDYVYLLRGSGTWDFMRYKVGTDAWETRAPAPGGVSTKAYKNGSSICYDGSDTIYCLKGSTNEFAAYSITGDNWVTKDPLPFIAPPGTKKKKVKDGSGMAFAGGTVYALKGGGTNEFWTYKTGEHKWYTGTEVPAGAKRVKGGGALTAARDISRLFGFRGNNTLEFWSYGPVAADGLRLTANSRPKNIQGNSSFVTRHPSLSVTPNPFTSSLNPSISYSLPKAGNVSLKLYDVAGKIVSVLAGGYQAAGSHSCPLPVAHYPLARGVYLLRFESAGGCETRKLVIE
jgi:hypothetical protein